MCELGWKSLGVPGADRAPQHQERSIGLRRCRKTDALLVWGGSPLYLCYWMRQ